VSFSERERESENMTLLPLVLPCEAAELLRGPQNALQLEQSRKA
jgi:hypothetical protein